MTGKERVEYAMKLKKADCNTDIGEVKRSYGERIFLKGNLDPTHRSNMEMLQGCGQGERPTQIENIQHSLVHQAELFQVVCIPVIFLS